MKSPQSHNPRQVFVDVAREFLWVREETSNWSSTIENFWRYTTYPNGARNKEPYCAAFACMVTDLGNKRGNLGLNALPRSPLCNDWPDFCRDNGWTLFLPDDRLRPPQSGDHVLFQFNSKRYNHIGIVDRLEGDYVITVEGNTNGEGSREGDGVYEKKRRRDLCALFLRCPVDAIKGKEK